MCLGDVHLRGEEDEVPLDGGRLSAMAMEVRVFVVVVVVVIPIPR